MPTDDPSSDSPIIRTGSDGRLRYTPEQRQALLEAFDCSGMSALSFTRLHGIQYQTFIAWVRKRREVMPKPHPSEPAFAEAFGAVTGLHIRSLAPDHPALWHCH